MKKSLLALAVLGAFAGVAQAQTSVTLYGSFDAGVRWLKGVDAANHSRTTMGSTGTYQSNRLGFRGVEDLGGGLNAHFNLEQDFNSGTGEVAGVLFNRTASVGLGGRWGAVDLGRQYSVNYRTIGVYDPFNYKFTTIIPLSNQGGLGRLNNDIQYTGTFGPITARVEYALGEQVGNFRNGSTAAGGVTYAAGPFSVGGAYTFRKNNVTTAVTPATATTVALPPGVAATTGANFQNQRNWTVGGVFATGPFRVAAGYADNTQVVGAGLADLRIKDVWLGGSYNLTPALALTAAWYHTRLNAAGTDGRRNLPIIGATYALSKRTNFYFDVDHARYTGANGRVLVANQLPNSLSTTAGGSATGRDRQTGVSVGINHLF
jgi:predicted porin